MDGACADKTIADVKTAIRDRTGLCPIMNSLNLYAPLCFLFSSLTHPHMHYFAQSFSSGMAPAEQQLTFRKQVLEDAQTLDYYGIKRVPGRRFLIVV